MDQQKQAKLFKSCNYFIAIVFAHFVQKPQAEHLNDSRENF